MKDPCSTSLTHCSYALHDILAFVFLVGSWYRFCWRFEGARGLKTLTSKYALSKRPPKKPFAAMSSLAPSSLIAEAPLSVSLVKIFPFLIIH